MARFKDIRAHARGSTKRQFRKFGWKSGRHCYWCGVLVKYHVRNHPDQATRDHLTPKSKGGTHGRKNIVVACWTCNTKRGSDMTWVPFHKRQDKPQRIRPDLIIWGYGPKEPAS